MARKKDAIQTHFDRLEVTPIPERSGGGIFNVDDLDPNKSYRVLATYLHRWPDGGTAPAFLIEGEGGQIIEKACDRFKVASVE